MSDEVGEKFVVRGIAMKNKMIASICLIAIFSVSGAWLFLANSGKTPSVAKYPTFTAASDETRTGDLVVGGGETRTIEGERFILEGNIIVNSGGTLVIRNSDVTVNSHYKNQYSVDVYSNATLLVENSILREGPVPGIPSFGSFGGISDFRSGETVVRPHGDSAQLIMRNSSSELRVAPHEGSTVTIESSYLGILPWKTGPSIKTRVTNSSIQMIDMWFTGGVDENKEFSGLTGGSNQNFHLESAENAALDIENTWVKNYYVALWEVYGERDIRKHITLKDSNIGVIFAVFPVGSDIKLRNMKPGLFSNWNIYDSMEGSGVPWTLNLINTTLDRWKLDFHGVAEIENSNFHLDTWGEASVTVRNSTMILHHSRGGYVKLVDTVISNRSDLPASVRLIYQPDITGPNPPYVYDFENSTLGPYADLEFTDDNIHCTFKGELSVLISPDRVHWFGGTVDREYPVRVLRKNGAPLAGVNVALVKSDNTQLWSGVTNENGRVNFTLGFGKDNYNENFVLRATVEGEELSKGVGFLTSTPILLSTTAEILPADTDNDGMPNDWETQYGLNPNVNDANQDADGDGYTNLQEYQAGTNPASSSSYPGAVVEVPPAGVPIIYIVVAVIAVFAIIGTFIIKIRK